MSKSNTTERGAAMLLQLKKAKTTGEARTLVASGMLALGSGEISAADLNLLNQELKKITAKMTARAS